MLRLAAALGIARLTGLGRFTAFLVFTALGAGAHRRIATSSDDVPTAVLVPACRHIFY